MASLQLNASQNHMATTFSFSVTVPKVEKRRALSVLHEAHALVSDLESELTEFQEESPIFKLNRAPLFEPVTVSARALSLWELAHYLEEVTATAFSPLAKSTDRTAAKVGWDKNSRKVWRETEGTHVSFGAIGKGYALDLVRELLNKNGIENFILEAGGSSTVLSGFEAPHVPWTFGWSWLPPNDGTYYGIKMVHRRGIPVALGVSGLQEKGRHILLRKSDDAFNYQSTLVACPSAAFADALSTAFFCLSWEESLARFSSLLDRPALASVRIDGVPEWNGVFENLWGSLTSGFLLCLIFSSQALADEGIDLNSLGMDDFLPYQITRQPYWVLAPLLMLVAIAVHLKISSVKKKVKPPSSEEAL